MGHFCALLPVEQSFFSSLGISRNDLDYRFLRRAPNPFGEKYCTVIRSPEIAQQRERTIDHLAFPSFPSLAHCCSLSRPSTHSRPIVCEVEANCSQKLRSFRAPVYRSGWTAETPAKPGPFRIWGWLPRFLPRSVASV